MKYSIEELKNIAKDVRRGIVDAVYSAQSGHPGGALSCADILTYLYFNEMNIDPKNPKMEKRPQPKNPLRKRPQPKSLLQKKIVLFS